MRQISIKTIVYLDINISDDSTSNEKILEELFANIDYNFTYDDGNIEITNTELNDMYIE